MIGNVEMVKAFMPYTKVTANPKGRGFVSYLHVAAKYGQLEILKILLEHFEKKKFDWLKLKDKEGRSVWDLLKVSKFQKQIFLFSFEPKNEQYNFFDFCPKDLKYVKSKKKGTYYVKFPLIKSLHFFDSTHFLRLGHKSFEARAQIKK